MTSPYIGSMEQISHILRRHGLEGESAFQCLVHAYVINYPEILTQVPENIIKIWSEAYRKISSEPSIVDLLSSFAKQDPQGNKLAEWYQFFIGRKYREGSGKFFTPKSIAHAMVKMLPKKSNPIIMDPTCGGGTFLSEFSKLWKDNDCSLIANDIETSLIELSMATLSLSTPGNHTKVFSTENIYDPTQDLIKWYGKVDYILANPPFSLNIQFEQFDSKLYNSGYRNSDALFIDIAYKLLKPKGRLVCLLPHSIICNTEFVNLRLLVEDMWTLLGVFCLPEGIFMLNAGTTTRADIVVLKKRSTESVNREKTIFASIPSAGVRLSNNEKLPIGNDLDNLIDDPDILHALEIQEPEP